MMDAEWQLLSGPSAENGVRAAQYIRMSTDAQDLSPEIQTRAISEFALRNGITVVDTYIDAGRSGLTLNRRPAMKRLLTDVESDACPFSLILVYDISRWGRFQDTDASAYYEYHCRMQGVQVRYVQEAFSECDTPMTSVLKSIKRAMAAEYSRELAVKTQAGQRAAIGNGFQIGTLPCLGITRVAVSKHDRSERPLTAHEHKAASREHVRWVSGSETEVALVRRIFHIYTTTGISIVRLAHLMQREGVTDAKGGPLTSSKLYSLISCEALIGNFVWGREDHGRRRSDQDTNLQRVPGCIEPAIEPKLWEAAQAKRAKRAGQIRTREELLAYLAKVVEENPRFTGSDLKKSDGPSRQTYVKHFGSLSGALRCLGLEPARPDSEHFAHRRKACRLTRHFCGVVQQILREYGLDCSKSANCGHLLVVNGAVRVRVQIIWRAPRFGITQWSMRKIYREPFDHVFVVRLNENDEVFDSMLLARDDYFSFQLWFPDGLSSAGLEYVWSEQAVATKFADLHVSPPRVRSRSSAGLLGAARRAADLVPVSDCSQSEVLRCAG